MRISSSPTSPKTSQRNCEGPAAPSPPNPESPLFPHLSVGENVGYGLNVAAPSGGVSDAERVESLLDLVDLDGMGDRAIICVRPENLAVGGGPNAISATVESTEFLGETSRVRLDWQGRPLVVRTADSLNGTVEVGFDPDGAHLVEML